METTLRSRVAKLKKQTNSNLLGMDRSAAGLAQPGASVLFFYWVGPPGKLQAASPQALKLDRTRALGYYKILKTKGKLC